MKIGLERIDTQEGVIVEALLDSGATGLVISLEFTRTYIQHGGLEVNMRIKHEHEGRSNF